MPEQHPLINQLAERLDRLLVRYAELQKTNELLTTELQSVMHERDLMQSKLQAARSRIDTLIESLPGPLAQTSTPKTASLLNSEIGTK